MPSIKEAKRELRSMRTRIVEMNPTQLTNFFKPFSPDKLLSIHKSIGKALDVKKKDIIQTKQKQIERLQKELEDLRSL